METTEDRREPLLAASDAVERERLAEGTRSGHLGYVDGLRALAALYVVLDHARMEAWATDLGHQPPRGVALLTNWSVYGTFAVALFIVVSGFCLTLPVVRGDGLLRGGAKRFVYRRARRILPPFYGAALLSLVLIWTLIGSKTGTHWDVSVPVTTTGYLANLFMLQDVLGEAQINHAFWSIALEWQIYFTFPILIVFWRRIGVARTVVGTVLVAYVAFLVVHIVPAVGPIDVKGFRPEFLAFFALGMLGAVIAFSSKPIWGRVRTLPWNGFAAGCALAGVLACFAAGARTDHLIGFLAFLFALCGMSLLVSGARTTDRNLVRDVLGAPKLAFLGAFSYSLYLIHAPLLQVEWQYGVQPLGLSKTASYALLLGAGIPAIVAASYAFFLACERPFMSSKQKRASEGEFVDRGPAQPTPATVLPVDVAPTEAVA